MKDRVEASSATTRVSHASSPTSTDPKTVRIVLTERGVLHCQGRGNTHYFCGRAQTRSLSGLLLVGQCFSVGGYGGVEL